MNELALMGSMLLSLIKFDGVCARASGIDKFDSDNMTGGVMDEQNRN